MTTQSRICVHPALQQRHGSPSRRVLIQLRQTCRIYPEMIVGVDVVDLWLSVLIMQCRQHTVNSDIAFGNEQENNQDHILKLSRIEPGRVLLYLSLQKAAFSLSKRVQKLALQQYGYPCSGVDS